MRRQRVDLESVWDMNVHVSVFSLADILGIHSKISAASINKNCENVNSNDVIKVGIGMQHQEETRKFIVHVDAMIWNTPPPPMVPAVCLNKVEVSSM
jgi:hypothetical protein